jgi:hypothetical protein
MSETTTTITDEQARIIGREIGYAIGEKVAAVLARAVFNAGIRDGGTPLADRIIEAIRRGLAARPS